MDGCPVLPCSPLHIIAHDSCRSVENIHKSDSVQFSIHDISQFLLPIAVLYSIDGNAYGKPCMFPFLYKDRWFGDCTAYDSSIKRPWCAIGTKYDHEQWGYCPTTCELNAYLVCFLTENDEYGGALRYEFFKIRFDLWAQTWDPSTVWKQWTLTHVTKEKSTPLANRESFFKNRGTKSCWTSLPVDMRLQKAVSSKNPACEGSSRMQPDDLDTVNVDTDKEKQKSAHSLIHLSIWLYYTAPGGQIAQRKS